MGMVGLIGYNMFNNTGNVGTKLWEMALNEGGGNPSMKHNPIYVKSEEEKSEPEETVTEVKEQNEVTKIIEENNEEVTAETVSEEAEAETVVKEIIPE